MKNKILFISSFVISISAFAQIDLIPIDNSLPKYSCTDYVMKINNWEICEPYDSILFDQKIGLIPTNINNEILSVAIMDDDSGNYKDYLAFSTIHFSGRGVTDVIINDRGLALNGVQVGDPISSGIALLPRWKEKDAKTIIAGYGNLGGILCIIYENGIITEIGYYESL